MPRRNESKTTVSESYSVTVPTVVRESVDLDPGDKLRWVVSEDGTVAVEVVEEQAGAFSKLEPIDIGEETNAVEDHDRISEFE